MNIFDVTEKIHKNNYTNEKIKPAGVCLHITTDEGLQALDYFSRPDSKVSAHDIIARNGDIYMCVPSDRKAYHAGVVKKPTSKFVIERGAENPNNYLIGIEVVAKEGQEITAEQYKSIAERVEMHSTTHNFQINRKTIIGHNQVNSIDKAFCPISSYSPNEILMVIEFEKVRKRLENANIKLKTEVDVANDTIQMLEAEKKREVAKMEEKENLVGHWAENAINEAKGIGIVKGYEDGSFRPDRGITRAETVQLLMNLLHYLRDIK